MEPEGSIPFSQEPSTGPYVTGPRQCSPSWVWGPLVSRPYFTVSDLRFPLSSTITIRRVTVEVFDPASTRVTLPLKLIFF
jgi:hypothetical protein